MEQRVSVRTKELILCGMFTALVAVGAFIRVPMPAVPFTMQTLFVGMAGLLLGKKYGSLSVGLYVLIGLLGVPIFTNGGGIGYIFQPSFGFLIGFIISAYVVGLVIEKMKSHSFKNILLAQLAGMLAVYPIALIYLYIVLTYYMKSSIAVNVLLIKYFIMFLPGDIIKAIVGAMVGKQMLPIMRNNR